MKTNRQAQSEAKRLFGLCLVGGSLDETRVRQVVEKVIAAGRPGGLKVLSIFQRRVRLRQEAHSAKVESASPLSGEVQAQIESELTRMYGPGLSLSYGSNPALLSG